MKLGVIMDPIARITVKKDSTLAMLLAAQKRGWDIQYMELNDIYVVDGKAMCNRQSLEVRDDPERLGLDVRSSKQSLVDLLGGA